MKTRAAAALMFSLIAAMSSPAPSTFALRTISPSTSAKIEAVVQQAVKSRHFSGTVLVWQKGKLVLRKGYGMADSKRHIKNAPETKFSLPGVSALFTAAAIEQLREHQKLSLQDPISKYLSPCPAAWRSITIQQLMNGTSGIVDPQSHGSGDDVSKIRTVADYLAAAARHPLQFTPGTRVGQGMAGFVVLIPIIEKVSGESYATYLAKHMFQPLRMTHTGVRRAGKTASTVAIRSGESSRSRPAPSLSDDWTVAADGVYSTVDDLYRWDEAVLGCSLVSPQALFWALAPGRQVSTVVQRHWTVQVSDVRDGEAAGERIFPLEGTAIVVLANQGGSVRSLLDQIQGIVVRE